MFLPAHFLFLLSGVWTFWFSFHYVNNDSTLVRQQHRINLEPWLTMGTEPPCIRVHELLNLELLCRKKEENKILFSLSYCCFRLLCYTSLDCNSLGLLKSVRPTLANEKWVGMRHFQEGCFKSQFTVSLFLCHNNVNVPDRGLSVKLVSGPKTTCGLPKPIHSGYLVCKQKVNLCYYKPLRFGDCLLLQHIVPFLG